MIYENFNKNIIINTYVYSKSYTILSIYRYFLYSTKI